MPHWTSGVDAGVYTLVVKSSNSAPVTISDSLEVVASGPPPAVIPVVSAPNGMRRGVAYTFTVQWGNTGLNDAPAPLLTVGNTVPFGSRRATIRWAPLHVPRYQHPRRPPGILRPGQTEMMTFHAFSGTEAGEYTAFADRVGKGPTLPFNWESLRNPLFASALDAAELNRAFLQLVAQVGPLWVTTWRCSPGIVRSAKVRWVTAAIPMPLCKSNGTARSQPQAAQSPAGFAPDTRLQFSSLAVSARKHCDRRLSYAPVSTMARSPSHAFPRRLRGEHARSAADGRTTSSCERQRRSVGFQYRAECDAGRHDSGYVRYSDQPSAIAGATITLLSKAMPVLWRHLVRTGRSNWRTRWWKYTLVAEVPGRARSGSKTCSSLPNSASEILILLLPEAM